MSTAFIAQLRARCRACGFTLIELMITLAVAAILAMIAVPSFRHVLVSTNLSSISNDLGGDLQYARVQAVSRQTNVEVASSSGSWQNGWTVEIPPATTAGGAVAEVLRVHPAVPAGYVVSAGNATLTYQAQGSLSAPVAGTCFTIYAPDGQNNQPLYLSVSSVGSLQQAEGPSKPDLACASPP